MLSVLSPTPSQTSVDRETRVQTLLDALRSQAEPQLRQMAERLVDLPEDKAFGQIEYDLGDLGRAIATCAHQAGLAGKKGGT